MVKAMAVVHLEEGESIGAPQIPTEAITIEQAIKENPLEWEAAISSKLMALLETGTFKILRGKPPPGKHPISSKTVLRNKPRPDRSIARRKARVVIRGFKQTYRIDYFKTFASVIRYNTLRLLLAKAAAEDLEIDHMDVNTAFLNPKCEEEIYMEIPDFFHLVTNGIT